MKKRIGAVADTMQMCMQLCCMRCRLVRAFRYVPRFRVKPFLQSGKARIPQPTRVRFRFIRRPPMFFAIVPMRQRGFDAVK